MTTDTAPAPRLRMSGHALDRCRGERQLPPEAVYAIVVDKLRGFENLEKRHIAVRVFEWDTKKGSMDKSYGETLWAIVREANITTCFFREKWQSTTKDSFRVDTVVW